MIERRALTATLVSAAFGLLAQSAFSANLHGTVADFVRRTSH